jgi:hypothetical protein
MYCDKIAMEVWRPVPRNAEIAISHANQETRPIANITWLMKLTIYSQPHEWFSMSHLFLLSIW